MEQNSDTLNCILKWSQCNKTRKFINRGRSFSGVRGLKINSSAIVFAAKRNDYERVKVLFRYGYRLQRCDTMTDPLKKIELFKAKNFIKEKQSLMHRLRRRLTDV